jgi:hypothetical protein
MSHRPLDGFFRMRGSHTQNTPLPPNPMTETEPVPETLYLKKLNAMYDVQINSQAYCYTSSFMLSLPDIANLSQVRITILYELPKSSRSCDYDFWSAAKQAFLLLGCHTTNHYSYLEKTASYIYKSLQPCISF